MNPATVSQILNDAADLISDPKTFVRDYSARGFNPVEVARGEHLKKGAHAASCLPTGDHVERWNALGAIWKTALTQHEAVRAAHSAFVAEIGSEISVSRWCATNEQAEQVAALRAAADRARLSEAA